MTAIGHAPVPRASRLIDADTVNLTAIRKADNAGRFPVNGTYASRSAATSPELLATATEDFREGYARGYADALGRAVTVPPAVSDAELVELAAQRNPVGVHLLAEAIRNGCPPWCSEDHRGQITEQDGFAIGLVHERVLAELTAQDPSWSGDHAATATVLVESTTEAGEGITAPRIVLTVAEGDQGGYPGSEDVQGWTGTPAEARALAAALLAAAELVDGGAAR